MAVPCLTFKSRIRSDFYFQAWIHFRRGCLSDSVLKQNETRVSQEIIPDTIIPLEVNITHCSFYEFIFYIIVFTNIGSKLGSNQRFHRSDQRSTDPQISRSISFGPWIPSIELLNCLNWKKVPKMRKRESPLLLYGVMEEDLRWFFFLN